MAKTAHGGFTPPKGNPSGSGRRQQGTKDLQNVNIQEDQQLAEDYTKTGDDDPSANVHVEHPNRNVNKGEDTKKPNQKLDL